MKYSELERSSFAETELQERLAGGSMTTITTCIPRNFKKEAEDANLRGISFSFYSCVYA